MNFATDVDPIIDSVEGTVGVILYQAGTFITTEPSFKKLLTGLKLTFKIWFYAPMTSDSERNETLSLSILPLWNAVNYESD